MHQRIMAIGAHADDVELHSGGTLFKYLDRGYEVVYVQSTNNMSGNRRTLQPGGGFLKSEVSDTLETMAYRKREAADAARLFGTEPVHLDHPQRHCHVAQEGRPPRQVELRYGCPLPPGVPPDVPTILTAHEDAASVERLARLILDRDPEAILTHGHAEMNPEHSCTFLLVAKAYWKAVERGFRGSLLSSIHVWPRLGRMACCWETWVDISGEVDRRMEAVRCHVSQYPPDFEGGAVFWREHAERLGARCGVGAAEIFDFVNTDVTANDDTLLLAELLRNRAGREPWGL